MNDQDHIQQVLGYTFRHPDLLRQALTHSSAAHRHQGRLDSNERLEFLGDRVLGLIVAEWLFKRFPEEEEGALARRFAALVRRETLTSVAEKLEIGNYLIVNEADDRSVACQNPSVLADACEALIGALFLDGGLTEVERIIKTYWHDALEADITPPQDAKTTLQEWAQARKLPLPVYRELRREGPPHDPLFTIEVSVDGYPPQQSQGSSKRLAEQFAAIALLDEITVSDD